MTFKVSYKDVLINYMTSVYLTEDLSSEDKRKIKEIIKDELERQEKKIKKNVIDSIKNESDFEDKMYEVVEKAMLEFYKLLWTKKEIWIKSLRKQ